tara:strand:+ start:122 stop:319 length:198 start_codon:yes stop_codon:yes gene_type:complete
MEYKASKKLAQETIEYAKEMTPMDRNDFIDLMSDQYHIAIHRRYPKREVKKFSDLLTKLVKKFGN